MQIPSFLTSVRSLPLLVAVALVAPLLAKDDRPVDAPPRSTPAGDVPRLTLDEARGVMQSAMAEAKRLGAGGAFAVVDEGGHLLCLERVDGTFAAAPEVSTGKARTAVKFAKPTKFFEDLVNNGRTTMVALPDFTPLQGGVPIVVRGRVIGAIGVSGAASAQQDDELAQFGARALAGRG